MKDQITKKNNKGLLIVVAAVVMLVFIVVIGIVISTGSKRRKYEEQISLAERYLNEMDYDKAIAAYKAAIEIDPERPDAFEDITNVYLAKADASPDDETALEHLNEAVSELNKLEQEGIGTGFIEEYRIRLLSAQARFRGSEQEAKKADENSADDEVSPTESPDKEVTPTESLTPTEDENTDDMKEDDSESGRHAEAEKTKNLVLRHYEYKYMGDIGFEGSNGEYQIDGNMFYTTLIYAMWDNGEFHILEMVKVTVNMDTGLCTDDKGESTYLW